MLTAVVPPARQPVARIGDTVDLQGHHLDGTGREVLLTNDRFEIDTTIAAAADRRLGCRRLDPVHARPGVQAASLPVGVYQVGARLVRPGESDPRETNRLAMTLAPQMTNLPLTVARDGSGTASFTINFTPALRAGQTVALVLGQEEFRRKPHRLAVDRTRVSSFPNAPVGSHLARLRIDGIDSPIIDVGRSAGTPTFLNQRIDHHMNAPERVDRTGPRPTSGCWWRSSRG